jgi:hypothetical protein
MNDLAFPMPKPTAQVEAYVEVLGVDLAIDFILMFGGADLYLPNDPKGGSEAEKLLGYDKLKALAARPNMQRRVPLAKRWLAKMLHWKGYTNAHIARTLRVSTTSVQRFLKDEYGADRNAGN